MHGTTAPTRAAGGSTEQLRHEFSRRHAFGQCVTMATMSTEDGVFGIQVSADSRGDCLLSDVSMTGSMNQSSLMTASQLLFGLANNLHRTIKRKNLFVGHVCGWMQQQEVRGIELFRVSGTPVSNSKGTFADVAQASGQQLALNCRYSCRSRQFATNRKEDGNAALLSVHHDKAKTLGKNPYSPFRTGSLGDPRCGTMSKNSEGAEYTASHPDQTDNPRFSRKQYSCEKNDVIHFCIMTGRSCACKLKYRMPCWGALTFCGAGFVSGQTA